MKKKKNCFLFLLLAPLEVVRIYTEIFSVKFQISELRGRRATESFKLNTEIMS